MATYAELYGIHNDTDMVNRASVAILVAAEAILVGVSPTADQVKWADHVTNNPKSEGVKVYRLLLAGNKSATTQQITDTTDATMQTKVDALVPSLVIAHNA